MMDNPTSIKTTPTIIAMTPPTIFKTQSYHIISSNDRQLSSPDNLLDAGISSTIMSVVGFMESIHLACAIIDSGE